MLTRGVKIQLVAFAVITVAAAVLLAARLDALERLFHPPFTVTVHLAKSGGLYPRAGVDLLGTPVGRVRELTVDPGGDVVATLDIDHDARIPAGVRAAVSNRSPIGEQYLALTPTRPDGPPLTDGAVIPVDRTSIPVPAERLLGRLNALLADLPPAALATVVGESARGFGGSSIQLGQLIEHSDSLTRTALAGLDDQLRLIDGAATVLDTQNAAAGDIVALSRRLASVTDRVRTLIPTLAAVLAHGAPASDQLGALARDNVGALPPLLEDLADVTGTVADHRAGLRKTLAATPWVLQYALGAIRYCDANDPITGRPVESTCLYDAQGRPEYQGRLAITVPAPGDSPLAAEPCTYQGARRELPNGAPVDGPGPAPDRPVGCTAAPTDPATPNVRGAQNLPR